MDTPLAYLPQQINTGPWLTAYTRDELERRVPETRFVLPICSLGTPVAQMTELAPLVLPPLYHEALDADLKSQMLHRIGECFPFYIGTSARKTIGGAFEVVELSPVSHPPPKRPKVMAFSVDTAVEEHGPHLPLATDTVQSYGVLERLAAEFDGFTIGPPVEYGHLTWGLPFGLSIDITPPLLTRYVTGFANAVLNWANPEFLYVVDVHGSPVHRQAICGGLDASRAAEQSAFRWLHEPLVSFAGDRGDQHAGGVETALVEHINAELIDRRWFPDRVDDLAAGEMSLDLAVALTPELPRFIGRVESQSLNGIVGRIRNYFDLDAADLMERMLGIARDDVRQLIGSS